MNEVPILCPIQPYELDKRMRRGFEDIVRRVAVAASLEGVGQDLLLRIYLAGLYHGSEHQKARRA